MVSNSLSAKDELTDSALVLNYADERSEVNSVWWVQGDERDGVVLSLTRSDDTNVFRLRPSESGILCFKASSVSLVNGNAKIVKGDFAEIVKLQAFIDAAFNQETMTRTPVWSGLSLNTSRNELSSSEFKKWLITLNLKREGRNSAVCNLLRSTESYWIVRFLLDAYKNELSLKSMGERYGLSSSHFRRITKQALGNSTKYELCQWRLANALLELLEGNISITDIAIKHGYASLSHFSNEVKSTLGIPPRKLKNLIESNSYNESSK